MSFVEYEQLLDSDTWKPDSQDKTASPEYEIWLVEKENQEETRARVLAKDIVNYVLDEIEKDSNKIGVLLCEGCPTSIDKTVYSAIFPNLVVIPVGSCTTIIRLLHRVRKKLQVHKVYAFGLIDRDALSKKEIKHLFEERKIYTTKLPFIENIICTPEVLMHICEARKLDFERIKKRVQDELIKMLWKHLKDTLPINIAIQKDERIENIAIQAATKEKKVEKVVNRDSILYAYRDKVIVSVVANAIGIRHRKDYYEEIKRMLEQEKYHDVLVRAMAKYVPKLELYDLELVE